MEIKEAKKIYFELVQNYNLFIKETGSNVFRYTNDQNYLIMGLLPVISEILENGNDIMKFANEVHHSIVHYSETTQKYRNEMDSILSDKYLTSKSKDLKGIELRNEISLVLNDLVKSNTKLFNKQEKVFTPVLEVIKNVKMALGEFADEAILPNKIDLYKNSPECTDTAFTKYFVDELYTPYPPLKDRDFNYFIRIGEEVSFTRHVEDEFEELGLQTLNRYLTNFKVENYWKEQGYNSKVEWLATIHEKRKEAEEQAYIEDLKMQQALKELKAQGKKEGF